jgi:hypothetical protein
MLPTPADKKSNLHKIDSLQSLAGMFPVVISIQAALTQALQPLELIASSSKPDFPGESS